MQFSCMVISMDEKNDGKQLKIDSILSEINTSIKEEVSKSGEIDLVEPQIQEDRPPKKKRNRSKPAKPREDPSEKKMDEENASAIKMNINSSFVESARIIEDAVEGTTEEPVEHESSHPMRFIAVTASEVVEDQPLIDQSFTGEFTLPVEEEKPMEIDQEISRENNRHIKKIRKKRQRGKLSRRQRINAILGMAMSFFIIIGVISTIWFAVKTTGEIVNNTSQKEELAKTIFPFVIIDIASFSDVAALDNTAIVSAAIWEFIIDEQDKSKYQRDELGSIYVPDVDIEYYIRLLFGNDVIIKHQSIENSNVMMNYDPETKMYNIESTPKILPYKPRVDKITRKDNIYTLKVSYILPDAMWNFNTQNKVEHVDKTMEYVLKKNKNSYQLLSVKMISVEGLSSNNYISSNGMSSETISDIPAEPLPGDPAIPLPDGEGGMDSAISQIPAADGSTITDDGASTEDTESTDDTGSINDTESTNE